MATLRSMELPLHHRGPARLVGTLAALALAFGCATAPEPRTERPVAERSAGAPDEWHRSAVIYGVVPPFFGGDVPLRAVTEKLPYLQQQGVDAIWIAPIQATDDPGAISYATTDFFAIRPDFGTEEDLRTLVSRAHALGMKVLLDIAPNHTSSAHPWFVDQQKRGKASPHHSAYERDAEGKPTSYFDWQALKNLNHADPAARRMLIDALVHWLREFDVDGYRIDAAWGPRDRHPDFWPEAVRAMEQVKPDVFLLAEASARDGYWIAHGFDAAYDWTVELGRWSWAPLLGERGTLRGAFVEPLAAGPTPPDRVLRFLDNNDTGKRFVTRHGPRVTKVASTLMHTLPGIALVFTGEEVCAEYEPYEDPPPISWEDRCGLRAHYRRLAELRERNAALRLGAFVPLPTGDDTPSVFAFARDAGEQGAAIVLLNFGKAAKLRLALPVWFEPLGETLALRDLLTGREVTLQRVEGGRFEVALEAESALVLAMP